MTIQEVWEAVKEWILTQGYKIVIALLIWFISFKIINAVTRKLGKSPRLQKHDKTIVRTLLYVMRIGLKIVILVCLVGYVGIDTSGLSALIASLGVTVGLALNGALANLAGGILLILTRPFRIDDYIEALGYAGTVEAINLTNTKLCTPDNKVVYLPNGSLSTASIVNYSEKDIRRVAQTYELKKDCDVEKAKQILRTIAEEGELILKDPAPFVKITGQTTNSVSVTIRVWTQNANYWDVDSYLWESVKKAFDENGIIVPVQQVEVSVNQK